MLVRVIGLHGDHDLGVQAHVHLHVEGLDLDVFYRVVRDLRLKGGVEVEAEAGEEKDQDDEEAVAAADALHAASAGAFLGVVPGDIAAVRRWRLFIVLLL